MKERTTEVPKFGSEGDEADWWASRAGKEYVKQQSAAAHSEGKKVRGSSLIAKMNAASAYGRARWLQGQLFYASLAFQVHDQNPASIDFDALLAADDARFSPFTPVDGNRMYASFTHLVGYASNYYTYVLDKVIAIDFFAQFDKDNLLDGPTAMRYRRAVLEPGASKPASQLVKDFLGREQNMDAIKSWMNEEFKPQPVGMK